MKKEYNQKILLINDCPDAIKMLHRVLTDIGCTNIDIDDGKKAKKKIKRNKYDLVIQDLQRPAPNGFELYYWMKHHKAFRNIPIILATASRPREIVEKYDTEIDGEIFHGTFLIDFYYSENEFGKRPKHVGNPAVLYVEGYQCLRPYLGYLKKDPKYIQHFIEDIFSYRSSIRDIEREYERRNIYLWPKVLKSFS